MENRSSALLDSLWLPAVSDWTPSLVGSPQSTPKALLPSLQSLCIIPTIFIRNPAYWDWQTRRRIRLEAQSTFLYTLVILAQMGEANFTMNLCYIFQLKEWYICWPIRSSNWYFITSYYNRYRWPNASELWSESAPWTKNKRTEAASTW